MRTSHAGALMPHPVPPRFVAVSRDGASRVAISDDDGVTWQLQSAPADDWEAVCYNGALYVAVASGGSNGRVMTSPDGVTWTSRNAAASLSWRSVCWDGTQFIAGSNTGTTQRIMTSPDGITWTLRTAAFGANWNALAANSQIVIGAAESQSVSHLMYSSDHGNNWLTATSPDSAMAFGAAVWSGSNFVAVANTEAGDVSCITSPDGINWTKRPMLGGVHSWEGITVGDGRLVAVSSQVAGGTQVATSDDHGLTWSGFAASIANTWRDVAWNTRAYCAVADVGAGTRMMTSPDGQVWTTRASPANNQWTGICARRVLPLS